MAEARFGHVEGIGAKLVDGWGSGLKRQCASLGLFAFFRLNVPCQGLVGRVGGGLGKGV